MITTYSVPTRLPSRLMTALALAWAVGGVACAGRPVATAQAPRAASAAAPAPSAYRGLFASPCQKMDEELYFVDSIELSPTTDVAVVAAQYRKALYTQEGCAASARMVTLNLPAATWTLNGQTQVAGKTVDLVTVQGTAGTITLDVAQPARVKESADRITLAGGKNGAELPIAKAIDGSNDKALRLIEQGRLYQGNDAPLAANGYPAALDMNNAYTRQ